MNNRPTIAALIKTHLDLKEDIHRLRQKIKTVGISHVKMIAHEKEKYLRYLQLTETISKENETASEMNHIQANRVMSATLSFKQKNANAQLKASGENLKDWFKIQRLQNEKKIALEHEISELKKLFKPIIDNEEMIEEINKQIEEAQAKLSSSRLKICFYTWQEKTKQKQQPTPLEKKSIEDVTKDTPQLLNNSLALFNESPLRTAVRNHPEQLHKLIHQKKPTDYPLHLAAQICSKSAVQTLLHLGLNPAEFDQHQKTAVFYLDQNKAHADYSEIKKMLAEAMQKKSIRLGNR